MVKRRGKGLCVFSSVESRVEREKEDSGEETYNIRVHGAVILGDAGSLVLCASFNAVGRDGTHITGRRGKRNRDMSREFTGKLDWVALNLTVGGFGASLRWSNGGGGRREPMKYSESALLEQDMV